MSPSSLAKADKGQPSSPFLGKTGDSGDPGYENVYSRFRAGAALEPRGSDESSSAHVPEGTKACVALLLQQSGQLQKVAMLPTSCGGPVLNVSLDAVSMPVWLVWISGPAEGKVTVDCRGQHDRKALAQGGRLLSAEVQDVVNDHVDSGSAHHVAEFARSASSCGSGVQL